MKNPFFIIAGLFLLSYFLISQFPNPPLSDQPVTITRNQPPEILMFSSQTCHYCTEARAFFARHKLNYTEKDIDLSDDARRVFDLMNGRGTPLLIINGTIIHGYDEKMIRDAL